MVGDRRAITRDAYHTFLRLPWSLSLLWIGVVFFLANLPFAATYMLIGGIEGSDGSFLDSLSFSVETMATVGYGAMHPQSTGAHVVMIAESVVGLIVSALATGLVFSKFSRPTTRIDFSSQAVIAQHDGKRTLMFRVGNRRSNMIIEAKVHVSLVMTTTTAEGDTFYRMNDLRLVRDRQVGMTRGWTVMHVIDETSPLYKLETAEALAKAEVEIYVALTGIDDVTSQSIHTTFQYQDAGIRIGHRFADTLTALPDGSIMLDLTKFDVVLPER